MGNLVNSNGGVHTKVVIVGRIYISNFHWGQIWQNFFFSDIAIVKKGKNS